MKLKTLAILVLASAGVLVAWAGSECSYCALACGFDSSGNCAANVCETTQNDRGICGGGGCTCQVP